MDINLDLGCIELYKQRKRQQINMNNEIICSCNYRAFRALESNDFIVNDVQLDYYTIHILNAMYKHGSLYDVSDDINCSCSIINDIVKKYTK